MSLTTAVEVAPRSAVARTKRDMNAMVLGLSSRRNTSNYAYVVFGWLACIFLVLPMQAQWTQVWGGNFPGAANTTYNHANWWNNVQPNNPWGDGT